MKKSLISLFIGLSLGGAVSAHASTTEQRWFEVEVIVFERNITPESITEHWDVALTPSYSAQAKNPFAAFIDKSKLINPDAKVATNDTLLASTDSSDAELIPDTSALPEFGTALSTAEQQINNQSAPGVTTTAVTIDGANLKPAYRDPSLVLVPAAELQLNNQFKALNTHANYNVILHAGWRMQPQARNNAIPIHLFAGHNFAQQYNPDGSVITVPAAKASLVTNVAGTNQTIATPNESSFVTNSAPISLAANNVPLAAAKVPVWQLDGELTIYLEHYLYAKTDLFIRKEGHLSAPTTVLEENSMSDPSTEANSDMVDLLKIAGIRLADSGDSAGHNTATEVVTTATTAELSAQQVEGAGQANGTIVGSDILADSAIAAQQVPFLRSYPMQQLAVIRSGEIHYLDHPMFGMIIQIRKYEPPVAGSTNQ